MHPDASEDFRAMIGRRSLRYGIPRPAWHAQAACRGVGAAVFFTRGDDTHARALCSTCTVIDKCHAAALDGPHGEPEAEGIWAGTTGPERKAIARGQAA